VEKFLRFKANADWDGDRAWGVEAVEWSESESKEVARLCIERDWVSLEFIKARRVTFTRVLESVVRYFVGGRNSLYSTSGVQAGVGSWKLFVWARRLATLS